MPGDNLEKEGEKGSLIFCLFVDIEFEFEHLQEVPK